jgi:hypothetical protein
MKPLRTLLLGIDIDLISLWSYPVLHAFVMMLDRAMVRRLILSNVYDACLKPDVFVIKCCADDLWKSWNLNAFDDFFWC